MDLQTAWRRWTTPTVDGELARRREAVLLEVLATLVVLALAAQLVQWGAVVFGRPPKQFPFWWSALVLTTAAFVGLLALARSGRRRLSAGLVIGLLSGLSWLLLYTDGFGNVIWAFVSVAAVLLGCLLFGGPTAIAVALVHSVVFVAGATFEAAGVLVPLSGRAHENSPPAGFSGSLGAVLLLLLITRACWVYTREAFSSIDELISHSSTSSPLSQLRTRALTVREVEVVRLVAEGLSNEAIAQQLFLSPRTVQSHVANAMRKSASANRTALGVLAIREGLVPLTPEPTEASHASGRRLGDRP